MDGVLNPATQVGVITTEIVKLFIRRYTSLPKDVTHRYLKA